MSVKENKQLEKERKFLKKQAKKREKHRGH